MEKKTELNETEITILKAFRAANMYEPKYGEQTETERKRARYTFLYGYLYEMFENIDLPEIIGK